jgi:hypothetical protein
VKLQPDAPKHGVTIRHWTALIRRANHPKTRDIRVNRWAGLLDGYDRSNRAG